MTVICQEAQPGSGAKWRDELPGGSGTERLSSLSTSLSARFIPFIRLGSSRLIVAINVDVASD
jgi:hypothetical protein